MTRFHSDEYINFLQHVTPDNVEQLAMQHGGLEQGITRCKLYKQKKNYKQKGKERKKRVLIPFLFHFPLIK